MLVHVLTRGTVLGALAGVLLIVVALIANVLLQRQFADSRVVPTPLPTSQTPIVATPTAPLPLPTALPSATPLPQPTIPPQPTTSPTPQPTPIPPVPVPSPGPIVTDTKLGVGIYSSTLDINSLRLLRPAAILIQDPDVRTAGRYRENFPKALIIGRHFMVDGDPKLAHCDDSAENHQAQGAALADFIAARYAVALKGVVDAWVSDNEQATGRDPVRLACYAQFQLGFIEQLQGKHGIDAVAGNDGPGALDPADYPRYFAKAISTAKYFGVHSYGKPEARNLQTSDAIFYALRYRLIHDELVKAAVALPKGGFLLTETGLYEGWRGLVSDSKMAQDFIWLERETQKDSYVRAQFIFGLGTQGRFQGFEILGTNVLEQLGTFNATHPGQL